MFKKISYYFGDFLIVSALLILGFIYYPYISLYLFPPSSANFDVGSFSINIPKIRAEAPIIENINPWLTTEYQTALEKGVAQAEGSAIPGKKGTIFLFAHSSQPPWKITRTNTAFLRLGELKIGDDININYEGKKYTYIVTDKIEVWPSEVNYLKDLNKESQEDQTLILQTCTPLGTSLKRLLVFASLI